MTKIKNFFKKLWVGIKKGCAAIGTFFKENVWAEVLAIVLAILIFIFALQGILKAVDSCKNEETSNVKNHATTITSSELKQKIDANETFILFIGSEECSHCHEFYATVNRYVADGNEIFYIDTADTSDPTLKSYMAVITEKLLNEVPEDRGITSLATPTTVYVKNGEFADALQGAYGMEGGNNYYIFTQIVEGYYVGKATYTMD